MNERERYLDHLLSGFEKISNSEAETLVRLCNILSIPLTDDEFRSELTNLIYDEEFPQLPLQKAMKTWLENPPNTF